MIELSIPILVFEKKNLLNPIVALKQKNRQKGLLV